MKWSSSTRGLRALKTIGALKNQAAYSHRTQAHLDIYILAQERERLEKEKHQVLLRLESINDRLKTIGDRMNELKSVSEKESAKKRNQGMSSKKEDGKTWQVKNLRY